jgi:hypothetical protein
MAVATAKPAIVDAEPGVGVPAAAGDVAVPEAIVPETAILPTTVPVPAPAAPASPTPADAHPLAALRGLRMEVELGEPVHLPWRQLLVRFVVAYVLVVGSMIALTAAYVALAGWVGSAHP